MKDQMGLYYDEEGDFLEITLGDIKNCYFDNVGNGVFKIIDKETKEVKGIAVSSFKERTHGDELKIDLPVKMQLSS